jgi:UDP-N-acetylmuramoyl-tripeptide--D-alanyl-D-alanine ligase
VPTLNSSQLATAIGASHVGPSAEACALVADSRDVKAGIAFAAIGGGHAFVTEAIDAGAPFVLVQQGEPVPDGATSIVVDDTVEALMKIATVVRERLALSVVGITGSVGKTLTKDFAAAALGTSLRVHATPKNYNAEIGVPLTVLGCPDGTEVLVAELGARQRGEIAELCDIVRPRVGVVTGIGEAHLEAFGTREAIAETKAELLTSLPDDGLAVVPSEDEFRDLLTGSTSARVVTVGERGDVAWRSERIDANGRTHGIVTIDGADIDVTIPIPGRPLLHNAAIAVAVALEWGIDPNEAARAISDVRPTSWRMEVERIGPWTVINDAYNANPTSVAAALHSVRELARGAPMWAVLGEMAELGPSAVQAHEEAGRLARSLGFEGVVVVGEHAAGIAVGAGDIARRVETMRDAADLVRDLVSSGAFVLVKGSRVAGLERMPALLGKLIGAGA